MKNSSYSSSGSSNPYGKAGPLLSELAEACRRPLFVEIAQRERTAASASASCSRRGEDARLTAAAITARGTTNNPAGNTGTVGTAGEPETASVTSSVPGRKRERGEKKREANKRTWEQLLLEAARVLPYTTEREHAAILRSASILLLGFMLPYSTGNEGLLLQNAQRRNDRPDGNSNIGASSEGDNTGSAGSADNPFDPVQYVLRMSLEERMEKSVKIFASHERGEVDALTDAGVELAFDSFLSGLGRLLDGRPCSGQQVDLLHVLAMAIHPCPQYRHAIPHTSAYLDKIDPQSWRRAKRLMQSLQAGQFQVSYANRLRIVQLVADHLYLTSDDLQDVSDRSIGPLVHGAVPHLRAALRAFARTAFSSSDAHAAHCALVRIAAQTRNRRIVEEEWHFQLHSMVEDHTDYHCTDCHSCRSDSHRLSSSVSTWSAMQLNQERNVCLHSARGQLLSELIVRCFPSSQSDIDSDSSLTSVAESLTDAIEWQVDFWSQDDDDDDDEEEDDDEKKEKHAPCLLASLLSVATTLFHYVPKGNDRGGEEDDVPFSALTESSIQLLRHGHSGISRAAAKLLVASFGRRRRQRPILDEYAPSLFETLKVCIQQQKACPLLERVVAVAAQRSPAFGASALRYLLETAEGDDNSDGKKACDCVYRFIATVSSNCPSAAAKQLDTLVSLKEKCTTQERRMHIIASILSTRQARYLTGDTGQADNVVGWLLSEKDCDWSKYQIARHALETGNFDIASQVYAQLAQSTVTEKHYLWISALENVAAAEASLAKNAAKSIPCATIKLRSALSHLQSIEQVFRVTTESYSFQICFLLLRLDFLDLLTVFRQLTREMRLTGTGPQKHTRSFVHAQNLVKSLIALSFRYRDLNRRYGMQFRSGRSCVALQILQGASLFVATAAKKVFGDVLNVSLPTVSLKSVLGKDVISHPMAAFIQNLDRLLVEPMDSSMEPIVRAAATLELIDGIIMVPIPFPRDFVHPRPRVAASLLLSAEPEQKDDLGLTELVSVEGIPAMCFSVYCSGCVPESILRESRDPCWTLLVWYTLTYNGPLEDDEADDKQDDENQNQNLLASRDSIVQRMPALSKFVPVSAPLLNSGNFFVPIQCPPILDEGLFTIEVKLGCRDVAGREWDVPVPESSRCISVRIARSR